MSDKICPAIDWTVNGDVKCEQKIREPYKHCGKHTNYGEYDDKVTELITEVTTITTRAEKAEAQDRFHAEACIAHQKHIDELTTNLATERTRLDELTALLYMGWTLTYDDQDAYIRLNAPDTTRGSYERTLRAAIDAAIESK